MRSVLLLALILAASCTDYLSTARDATITYYTTAKSADVACQLGNYIGTGFYRAAASEYFYLNSAQCGVCYELTGEKGSIKVQITDKCPADSAHCGDPNKVHFDLDVDGFPYLCDKVKGICDVKYRMIPCKVSGGVSAKIKSGSNIWWSAYYIVGSNLGVKSVAASVNGREYAAARDQWNFWVLDGAPALSGSYSIKVTSIDGTVVNVPISSFTEGKVYSSGKEFPVPTKKFDPKTLKEDTSAGGEPEETPEPEQEPTPEPTPEPEPEPEPEPAPPVVPPTNTKLVYKNGFLDTNFQILNGRPTPNYCTTQSSSTCPIKGTFGAWADFLVYVWKDSYKFSDYTGMTFDVKTNKNTTIQVWINGYNDKKVVIQTSTSTKTVNVKFADLGITSGYCHGIEFQPFEDNTTLEINNIGFN